MKLTEGFILAFIAEIGIIAIALIYDAEYIDVAIGILMGLLGGYGLTKRQNAKEQDPGT